MGIVHRATLAPSKQELVESWLPGRPWASGRAVVDKLAEYRFDDPAGEVGVETILWRADDDAVLQTPLTYRAAPLAGAEAHLIGTSEHSVLGRRWVYDGCGDPVWAATLVAAIVSGGSQAQMFLEQDGERIDVPARMQVRGSGGVGDQPDVTTIGSVVDGESLTAVRAGDLELSLARVVGTPLDGGSTLIGWLSGSEDTNVLVALRHV